MGNQQAAFYYNLNADDSNDSGYFEDDVFESHARKDDASRNASYHLSHPKANLEKSLPKSKSINIVRKANAINNFRMADSLGEEQDPDDYIENSRISSSMHENENSKNFISTSWPSSSLSNAVIQSQHAKNTPDAKEKQKHQETKLTDSPPLASSLSSSFSLFSRMNYLGRMAQGVKDFYNEMNSATLTGAIDVVVVEQEDGSFKTSPFHVRFGKLALIKTKDLTVDIEINGQPVDLHMQLGEAGEAYFLDDCLIEEQESSSPSRQSLSQDESSEEKTESDGQKSFPKTDSSITITDDRLQDKTESNSKNDSPQVVTFFTDDEASHEESSPKANAPKWSWDWGQLPERQDSEQAKNQETSRIKQKEPSSSNRLFDGMFSLIRSNSNDKGRVSGGAVNGLRQDEIYLEEAEKMDGEMADLYLNQKSDARAFKPNLSTSQSFNSLDKNKEKSERKTRLSSEQIGQLNLNPGANEIIYSVTTALQGTTRITSYIFLWNYDDKIVVSDIDGTITKSDVLGQVLPIFGRDWTQAGVADLFSAIENNQYKFMYLSARAIGQSRITRDLLKNVNQGGLTLPKGPLLVTPTSLFTAFQKEVIEKKPEEFKIGCLKDIRSLFPSDHNPFYAGYGNKTSDVIAYKSVGIPLSRIFTINPQGHLKHEVSRTFQSSYSNLCDFADLIFPPVKPSAAIIKAEYDSFNFWRQNYMNDQVMAEIENELIRTQAFSSSKDAKDKISKTKSKKYTKTG